jgi:hypothetical protein
VAEQRPDLVVGFSGAPQSGIILSYALRQGPWHQYALSGLPIFVMSKTALPAAPLAAAGVVDRGESLLPPNFGLIPVAGTGTQIQPDGGIRDDDRYDPLQNIVYGPYVPLPLGKYTVTFDLEVTAATGTDVVVCEVADKDGGEILDKVKLDGAALSAATTAHQVSLTFNSTDLADRFEFRVWKQGGAHVLIKSYTLARAGEL